MIRKIPNFIITHGPIRSIPIDTVDFLWWEAIKNNAQKKDQSINTQNISKDIHAVCHFYL